MTPEEGDEGSMSQGRWAPPVYRSPKLNNGELDIIRKRQRERSRIMALLLGGFVILLFFITVVKIGINW